MAMYFKRIFFAGLDRYEVEIKATNGGKTTEKVQIKTVTGLSNYITGHFIERFNVFLNLTLLLGCVQENIFYAGNDIRNISFVAPSQCRQECQKEPDCEFWSFFAGTCYLKSDRTNVTSRTNSTSGTMFCPGKTNYDHFIIHP